MAELAAKLRLIHFKQRQQIERIRTVAWLENRFGRRRGLAVPRADFLAYVASKDPLLHPETQLDGNGVVVLDGEVADATRGIQLVRTDEGVGRAGIEARGAGAAVIAVCGSS